MTTTPEGPPPEGQPVGWVRLTIQGSVLTLGLTPAHVSVNGYPVATNRGENVLPVWAGRNHLDVEIRYLWTYGRAAIDVDVSSGQTVPVWYCAPWTNLSRGAIGFERQHAPDRFVYAVVLALIVLAGVAGFVAYGLIGG